MAWRAKRFEGTLKAAISRSTSSIRWSVQNGQKAGVRNFLLAQNLKTFPYNSKMAIYLCFRGVDEIIKFSQGDKSVKPCNLHIVKTLKLVKEMMDLADLGDADREDNGCGILYGVLRDSAYKLQKLAEEERKNHITKGWWHEEQ
jgi:hypothetical protein